MENRNSSRLDSVPVQKESYCGPYPQAVCRKARGLQRDVVYLCWPI